MSARVRVLVVDDSAFARKVLRESLRSHPGIEVVGHARDGLDALEQIESLRPDVVTLDLEMPHLDGVGVLRALSGRDAPRVVLTTAASDEARVAEALAAGAFDAVRKPTATANDRLYAMRDEVVAKVLAAAGARPSVLAAPRVASPVGRAGVVVVGASTGGPPALTRLLSALPRETPWPVAVVLHIPPGYRAPFAQRLDEASALTVVEASEGLALRPGLAVVAKAGLHLRFARGVHGAAVTLDAHPTELLHRPSVSVAFESAAEAFGDAVVAVVLTGMGDDGLSGARAVRAMGGAVLTEAESSCAVYGMPRVVKQAGLSSEEAPISAMADAVLRAVARSAAERAP